MFKFARPLVVTLLFGAALPGSAVAADNTHAGSLCNPISSSEAAKVSYSQFGVHNDSSTATATVECGAVVPTGTIQQVEVTMYDRNPGGGADILCTIQLMDAAGNTVKSAQLRSSSSSFNPQPVSAGFSSSAATNVNMRCRLPAVGSDGLSHITSYRIRTN